ncbi:uncharacterized protein LOC143035252 [Oratosquilla oratoria]|uniref:uncharacterized protein LOC143035252 n=1 Tax=Oratosquilla oratoria TaxID=337810 RepID=UPI003F770C5A
MKKLRKVFGSVTSLGSSDDQRQRRNSSHQNLAGASGVHSGGSPQISCDSQSLTSHVSSVSVGGEVDPFSKNDRLFTKLHKWAYLGDVEKLKKFIKKVNVDSCDSSGKTPLHYAAAQGQTEAVLFLLGSKANAHIQDKAGVTPLLCAVEKGQISVVQMFLQRKVDYRISDNQGNGVLHVAANTAANELLDLLLDCGCDTDEINKMGRTPLHVAAMEGQEEALESLLRCGASVNAADREGVTPLMMCAKFGNPSMVELLLEQGADHSLQDSSTWTAADYARFTNHNSLFERLLSLQTGSEGLSATGLADVGTDETSSHDEEFEEPKKSKESGDNSSSWSDDSDLGCVKPKSKFNISKFLPSSDESTDMKVAGTSGWEGSSSSKGETGPPKPPRLHSSASSISIPENVTQEEEEIMKPKSSYKDISHEDDLDPWNSSSSEEKDSKPRFSKLTGELQLSGKGDDPNRIFGDNDMPEKIDRFEAEKPSIVKNNSSFDVDMGNIKYHSSEEEDVSFGDDESEILPDVHTPKKIVVNQEESQELNQVGGHYESQVEFEEEKASLSLQEPSSKENVQGHSSPQSITSHKKKASIAQPEISGTDKESFSLDSDDSKSSKKASARQSHQHKNSLTFDSNSEDEIDHLPQKQWRKRSVSSLGSPDKLFGRKKEIETGGSNPDLSRSFPTHTTYEDSTNLPRITSTGAIPKVKSGQSANRDHKILNEQHSNTSVDSFDKVNMNVESKSSSLSTVVGTLGREGTMQEREEVWEVNASISPRHNSGDSEEEQEGDDSKVKQIDEVDLNRQDSTTIEQYNTYHQDTVEGMSGGTTPVKRTRKMTFSEMRATEVKVDVKSIRDKLSSSIEASLSPRLSLSLSPRSVVETERSVKTKSMVKEKSVDKESVNAGKPLRKVSLVEANEVTQVPNMGATTMLTKEASPSPRLSLSLSPRSVVETERSVKTKSMVKEKSVDKESVNAGKPLRKVSLVEANEVTQVPNMGATTMLTKEASPPRFTSTPRVAEPKNNLSSCIPGVGSIVFSDEDLSSQDNKHIPISFLDESDDVFSVASTETEESTHIYSGIKDSLHVPLASLPDDLDVSQLQEIVRELRLKVEKELGRRVALETKISQMSQTEKHIRTHVEQLENQEQKRLQEISNLTSRIKQCEYQSSKAQDEAKLHKQNHQDNLLELKKLEEVYDGMKIHSQQQEQVINSLMAQLQTKEKVNKGLHEKLQHLSNENKYISMKGTQTDDLVEPKKMVYAEVQVNEMNNVPVVSTGVQTDEIKGNLVTSGKSLPKETEDLVVSAAAQIEDKSCSMESEHTLAQTEVDLISRNESVQQCSSHINNITEESETEKLKESDTAHPQVSVTDRLSELTYSSKCIQTDETERPKMECRSTEYDIKTQYSSVATQNEFTQNSTPTQTETTLLNSEVHLKKLKQTVAILCCPSCKVTATQTEPHIITNEENMRPSDCREEKLSFDDISCIKTMLNDYQNEIKMLLSDWEHHMEKSDREEWLSKEISVQMLNLKDNLDSHLSDISSSQHDLAIKKVNSEITDMKNEFMDELRKLKTEINSSSSTEVVSHIEDLMHRDLMKIQKEVSNISHKQESVIIPKLEQSEQSHKNQYLSIDAQKKIEESLELQNKIVDQVNGSLGKQLEETLTFVKDFFSKTDENVFGKPVKDMMVTLKNLEDMIENGFKEASKTNEFDWDQKVKDLTGTLTNKIDSLPSQICRPDENGSVLADVMNQFIQDIKESNWQISQLLKARDSSMTVEVNEAMEENFQIVQDQIIKLQQNLVHKINEVAHQGHLLDDERLQNHYQQVHEVSNQLSKFQNNLIKIQTSLDTMNSLPGTNTVDESLLAVVRSSNEQVVTSLQHQSSSVVQLLETLQREVKNLSLNFERKQDSGEVHSLHAVITEKEREMKCLAADKEKLQEKIVSLNMKHHEIRLEEQEGRTKIKLLEERVHSLESSLRDNEQRLQVEVMKASNLTGQLTTLHNEHSQITAEKEKISIKLALELQRTRWLEEQYEELRYTKINVESKLHKQQLHQNLSMQNTSPTGKDITSLEDGSTSLKADIQRLECQKEDLKNQLHQKEQENKKMEMKLHEFEASLSLERRLKEEVEKELGKIKDDLAKNRNYVVEKFELESSLHEMKEHNKELQLEIEARNNLIGHLQKKLEMFQNEKVKTQEEMLNLKECKYSFDLLSQECSLGKALQEKTEKELKDLRLKVAHEYIPKSCISQVEKEMESRYQLDFNTKVLELHHQMEENKKRQNLASMVSESQEQGLKNNIAKLSQENIRLKNKLAVQEEEQDTWKLRHDKLMEIYLKEIENSRKEHRTHSSRKSSALDTKVDFKEISQQLSQPFMVSSFLGEVIPQDLSFSQSSVSTINNYTHTYSNALDETIKKHLFDLNGKPQSKEPEARETKRNGTNLHESCSEYVNLMQKKYGL